MMGKCLGYAQYEGKCENETNKNPYWCDRCDEIRRATITKSLEDISSSLKGEE